MRTERCAITANTLRTNADKSQVLASLNMVARVTIYSCAIGTACWSLYMWLYSIKHESMSTFGYNIVKRGIGSLY